MIPHPIQLKLNRIIPLAIIGIALTLAAEDTDYAGCKTFLDVITAPVKPHHHTKDTLVRWHAWRQAHPKWKYQPTHMVIAKLRFECPTPPEPIPVPSEAILLPLTAIQDNIDLDTLIDLPEPLPAYEQTIEDYQSTPGSYSTPYNGLDGGYPSTHTQQPPVPTPEPESLYLLGTGLVALVGVGRIWK